MIETKTLFEYCKENYKVYPEILGYHYNQQITDKKFVDELNEYDFVFISSDFHEDIHGYDGWPVMTSAELDSQVMFLEREFGVLPVLPRSEYTEVPSIGFVGRCPIFMLDGGQQALHKGFEARMAGLQQLEMSQDICTDYHIRFQPVGDSAGFYNESLPDFKKSGPLFRNNMLANQYQLCTRGNANWSLRFYETLAYGRIPLFLDTGGKFPINGNIAWLDDMMPPFPIVHQGEDIARTLLKFHENIGGQTGMKKTQLDCRRFYTHNFSQGAQIKNFDKLFGGMRL